jgi:hypothetical protein
MKEEIKDNYNQASQRLKDDDEGDDSDNDDETPLS